MSGRVSGNVGVWEYGSMGVWDECVRDERHCMDVGGYISSRWTRYWRILFPVQIKYGQICIWGRAAPFL